MTTSLLDRPVWRLDDTGKRFERFRPDLPYELTAGVSKDQRGQRLRLDSPHVGFGR